MTIRSRRNFLAKNERDRVERFFQQTNANDEKERRPQSALRCCCKMTSSMTILVVSCIVYFSPSFSPNHRQLDLISKRNSPGGEYSLQQSFSPFNSTPPTSIPLDINGSQQVRHRCLQSIRGRQENALRSIFDSSRDILLVDPAYHSNVGDHMITLGELSFFEGRSDGNVSQCSYIQAGSFVPPCETEIAVSSHAMNRLAVWHGGGNWGTLWRKAQEPRVQSFRPLLQHGFAIVTMPNSWYYRDDTLEKKDVKRIRDALRSGGVSLNRSSTDHVPAASVKDQVVFTWRETFSYNKAVEHFPFVTNLLVPDMAFQLGPYQPPEYHEVDLLVLLRSDHESTLTTERSRGAFRKILNRFPHGSDVTFSIVDWHDRLQRFRSNDIFFTNTAVNLLGLGRVVICDRLHAAILAYLSGLPFVYVDPVSGKITKTLSLALEDCEEDSSFHHATNLTEAVQFSLELLKDTPKSHSDHGHSREDRRNRIRQQLRREQMAEQAIH